MAFTNTKTPIVYYGGKTAIINHILPLIPRHNVYTEVFFGGGVVFWHKFPSRNETINDKLDIVINFYRQLRSNFKELRKLIDSTLISRTIHKEGLTILRNHKSRIEQSPVKLAWAFWLCTNFAYSNKIGGGYKYSNNMSVSVPVTLQSRKSNFTEHLVSRIENAYIENEDAIKVLKSRNHPEAFHYLDPPYFNADQGHYSGYTEKDFKKLLQFLQDDCNGKFLLSNYNSKILDRFIARNKWNKKEITLRLKAPRKGREINTEVLVWNYDILADRGQLNLFV